MDELSKFRARLGNASKNTTEYRMSMVDARLLLAEIDKRIELKEKSQTKEKSQPVTVNAPAVITRIMDGGQL